MNKNLAAAIVLPLAGCAALPQERPMAVTEIAWQTANAYDFAQTINASRRPDCYYEEDPLITVWAGRHPSSGEVGVAWLMQSAIHLAVSDWLDRKARDSDSDSWRGVEVIWQVLSFWDSGRNIVGANRIGLRPFGKADACRGL